MDRRRLLIALLWPTALVVLVGVLAFFQYRWLGQVSEADRERQRTTLNQRAHEFAADFDREIGRVFTALTFDPAENATSAEAFAKRYDQWKESAAFPQIVRGVYLTGDTASDDAPIPLTKFDPAARAFTPVEWPPSLLPVRDRLVTLRHKFTAPASPFSSAGNMTFRFVSVLQSPVMSAVPALLIPVRTIQHLTETPAKDVVRFDTEPRYVVVELDKQALTATVLPALVEKHLAVDDYRVEVLETQTGAAPAPVFRKGLANDVNLDPATADASTTFFGIRVENIRDTLTKIEGLPGLGSITLPPDSGSGRMSIVVSQGDTKAAQLKTQRELDAFTTAARASVEAAGQAKVSGGRGGAGTGATSAAVGYSSAGAWQLVLQHPAGSLDAAVARARHRNLGISFGVLAVLSVSVFLISINAQRSQRLAAQQMDFVATVSHELRTPIAVIRSAAQNLSAGVVHDAERAKRYGDLIDTEGRRLTEMVEEVLEFAGISGGKRHFSMAPADVVSLTRDVLSSCESLIREAGVELHFTAEEHLPAVNLDESAYRRALNNLITNALKYAADGGWLGVSVTATPEKQIAVAVADKGRGIDAKDLPHIFEAFYRGEYAKDRQIHGNGLGLSLVKRIVEAHGGSVSVHSSPTGSEFTMKFNEEQ